MATTNYYTVNGRIRGESTNGVSTTYGHDALGSVTGTYDQNGNPQNTYAWAPYGTQIAKTGTAADPKFGWNGGSGYINLGRNYSGLYVRARHYDKLSAAWSSVDSHWPDEPAYSYAECSPALMADPQGTGGGQRNKASGVTPIPCCFTPLSVSVVVTPFVRIGINYEANVSLGINFGWRQGGVNSPSLIEAFEVIHGTGDFSKPPHGEFSWPYENWLSTFSPYAYNIVLGTYQSALGSFCAQSPVGYASIVMASVDTPSFNTLQTKNGSQCVCQVWYAMNTCGQTSYVTGRGSFYANVSNGKLVADAGGAVQCSLQCGESL